MMTIRRCILYFLGSAALGSLGLTIFGLAGVAIWDANSLEKFERGRYVLTCKGKKGTTTVDYYGDGHWEREGRRFHVGEDCNPHGPMKLGR